MITQMGSATDGRKAVTLRRLGGERFNAGERFEVRRLTTHVAGVDIHWAVTGRASQASPVVLLHGLQDSHLTWSQVAHWLARDRQIFMPDLPGHGLSGRPNVAYDLAWYAQVIAAWMDAIAVGPADVVGHSLGGGIAQMLLLERRERVRRLVLAASGGLGKEVTSLLRLASIPIVVERFGQPFLPIGTRLALRRSVPSSYLAQLCAMNAQRGTARAFARTVRDVIDWRGQRRGFWQRVHDVGQLPPTALIWGDCDRIIPSHHAAALFARLDGLQLTYLRGCGHYLHHEQPERFAWVVKRFLDATDVMHPTLKAAETSS